MGFSSLESALAETETTISVTWSGGGNVQPDDGKEWSLSSLFKVAASFPSKVASCPQYINAILTPYGQNTSFLKWVKEKHNPPKNETTSAPNRVVLSALRYDAVYSYASELLEMYMGYKSHLALLRKVLLQPTLYRQADRGDALSLDNDSIIKERKSLRQKLKEIVSVIDEINESPQDINDIEKRAEELITPPEIWSLRLPVLKDVSLSTSQTVVAAAPQVNPADLVNIMKDFQLFPIVDTDGTGPVDNEDAPLLTDAVRKATEKSMAEIKKKSLLPLASKSALAQMTNWERAFVENQENIKLYQSYSFSHAAGRSAEKVEERQKLEDKNTGVRSFIDCERLERTVAPANWPDYISIYVDIDMSGKSGLLIAVQLHYSLTTLGKSKHYGTKGESIPDDMASKMVKTSLADDERIIKVKMGTRSTGEVSSFQFWTNKDNFGGIAPPAQEEFTTITCEKPEGFSGLKGFYGYCDSSVSRLGIIWGR
ncbi:hypothetical protein TWF694_006079 [Orbilia ellipsospora]|uniref:Jacalin-type lectin domain-containing protein n=1 Tax=Orbilia ellipsospora TaxID=2528407 RepID=A0AAV9WR47_9PEZI